MDQKQRNPSTIHQTDKHHYLMMTRLLANLSTQKNKANRRFSYTVVRKVQKKKRNDSLHDGIEVEAIHHHPEKYDSVTVAKTND